MSWIEDKYIGMTSTRFQQFKKRNNGYNFRCPYCGDSSKSKTKSRGWLYKDNKGHYQYHCFNCDTHSGFGTFLKNIDNSLYNEYKIECMGINAKQKNEYDEFIEKMQPKKFIINSPLKSLKKISQLKHDHPAKEYVVSRKIPNPYHAKMFYCEHFMSWVNSIIPNKFDKESVELRDEARIVIPFIDKDNNVHAVTGRALSKKSEIRYITIVFDETIPKIYGLDTVDKSKTVYVFEGPIDSMFINNAIAVAGGDLKTSIRSFDKSKLVLVFDNEPRSKQLVKKLDSAILNGYNVVIWPDNLEYKDINEMILNGLSAEFIEYIIKQNTYKDLAAKLALTKWNRT